MAVSSEALHILRHAGEQTDDGVDLGETALALAVLDVPGARIADYRDQLQSLADQVRAEGFADKLDDRLKNLRRVLIVRHKYRGDDSMSDDLRGLNLIQVVDRKIGSPIALGILYMHVVKQLGWPMAGIGFPGRFLVRLSAADGRVILDPSSSGKTCSSEDIRAFISLGGQGGDRLPDYYTPLSSRDILLRLLNGIKRRQVEMDGTEAAINTLQTMILIAPRRQELWRELGYVQAERGNLRSAITALEVVRDLSGESDQGDHAAAMAQQLKRQLN